MMIILKNNRERLWWATLRDDTNNVCKAHRDTLYSNPVIFKFDLSNNNNEYLLHIFDPINKEHLFFDVRKYGKSWMHDFCYHII